MNIGTSKLPSDAIILFLAVIQGYAANQILDRLGIVRITA
jgi:hypothetical protein